jgi:AcrR family transcriptional regulator
MSPTRKAASTTSTKPVPPPGVRRRMPRADRERQMLAVAEQTFVELGYQATSMDHIAERVGVSKPMIYEYFGSKEGLLLACVRRVHEDLREVTVAAVLGADSPREALEAGLRAYFVFMDSHRRAWTMLLQEPAFLTGPAADEVEAMRTRQAKLVAERLGGYRDLPEPDRDGYAQIVVGACERVALWRARDPRIGVDDAVRLVTSVLWPALAMLVGQR